MESILLVDDSPTVRAIFKRALTRALGRTIKVVEASTEAEAHAAFETDDFDAIVLDMMLLPEGNQAETTLSTRPLPARLSSVNLMRKMLKAQPELPIIIFTALDRSHPDVIQAMSLGAIGYLQKSIEPAALDAVLKKIEDLKEV